MENSKQSERVRSPRKNMCDDFFLINVVSERNR
nr:MAG TPA: programmed cell death activator [Caudoviricetes sp.]